MATECACLELDLRGDEVGDRRVGEPRSGHLGPDLLDARLGGSSGDVVGDPSPGLGAHPHVGEVLRRDVAREESGVDEMATEAWPQVAGFADGTPHERVEHVAGEQPHPGGEGRVHLGVAGRRLVGERAVVHGLVAS